MNTIVVVVRELLDGKKTYIIGGLMVVLGILTDDNQMVLTGLGFITTRSAIAKG